MSIADLTTSTTMNTTCPSWCLVDHLTMQAERQQDAERQCAWLDTHPDEAAAIFGSHEVTSGAMAEGANLHPRRQPGEPAVVDTYLLHWYCVGAVAVDLYGGSRGALSVMIETVQDGDGTSTTEAPTRALSEPNDWTGSYTPEQAQRLAAWCSRRRCWPAGREDQTDTTARAVPQSRERFRALSAPASPPVRSRCRTARKWRTQ